MLRSIRWGLFTSVTLAAGLVACGDDTGTGGSGGSGDGGNPATTSGTTTTGVTTSGTTTSATTTTGAGGDGQGGDGVGGNGQGGGTGGNGTGGDGGNGVGGGSGNTTTTGAGGSGTGETCGDAIAASEGSYLGTTVGFVSDYTLTAAGCTAFVEPGNDVVYEITIPSGEELQAVLFPDTADLGLYVVTDCADVQTSCVGGSDEGFAGDPEAVFYTNPSLSPLTVFVIVDSYDVSVSGSYELLLNIGTETTCDDLFDNDVDGFIDCADATACQGTASCTSGAGATGVVCTTNTQCASVGGDPACLSQAQADFPGGYCSEWCNLLADDCAGDAVCSDFGFQNDIGLCLDGCVAQSDCRVGYACETSGVDSFCFPAPDTCTGTLTATLGANAGDTTGGADDFASSCTTSSGDGAERVYTFTPATTGTLGIVLASASDQGFSVRTACGDSGSEVTCEDAEIGGVNEVGSVAVTAGTPVTIIVEAYGASNNGPYTLTLTLP